MNSSLSTGRKNSDADGLSRIPSAEKQERVVLPEVLKALSFSMTVENCPLVESMALTDTSAAVPPLIQPEVSEQQLQAHGLTSKDWRTAQQKTPSLKIIIDRIEQGLEMPAKKDVDPMVATRYFKEWEKLYLSNGVLHRKTTLNGQEFLQLVLPPGYQDIVFLASMMTLDTRAEIVQQCLSSNDSSGLEWTRLSSPRSKHAIDVSRGKQTSATEQNNYMEGSGSATIK